MAKSPYDITYDDIIKMQENRLEWMITSYPKMKAQGNMNDFIATKNIACQKMTIKLLKASKKNPQLNLNDQFDKLNG